MIVDLDDVGKIDCIQMNFEDLEENFSVSIEKKVYFCKKSYSTVSFYGKEDSESDLFLSIENSEPTTGSLNTLVDFDKIDGLNKLQTIIHIKVTFCKKFGIRQILFYDLAKVKCKDSDSYYAIDYRIFATEIECNNLSIYNKFFRERVCPQEMEEKLKFLRNFTYNDIGDGRLNPPINFDFFKNFHPKCDQKKVKLFISFLDYLKSDTKYRNKYYDLRDYVNKFVVNVNDYKDPIIH